MAATVSEILRHKGDRVVTIAPDETVMSVVEVLAENRIGATPVADDQGRLIGSRSLAQLGEEALSLSADRLMTREVMTCCLGIKCPVRAATPTISRARNSASSAALRSAAAAPSVAPRTHLARNSAQSAALRWAPPRLLVSRVKHTKS